MKFQVKAPKARDTRRGLFWAGVLYADGKAVMMFENAGDGGCTHFDWKPGIEREPIEAALRALVPGEDFEPLDKAVGELWDTAMLAPGQAVPA
jgi:hypothetical protein